MHIITGRLKGRPIKSPRGIRPTQDKVRKALFDILGDIDGLSFLDLYAGSGAVGLEAVSQGAGKVVFAERDRGCIEKIKHNLAAFGLAGEGVGKSAPSADQALAEGRCQVIEMDTGKAIERLGKRGEAFDIIFLDPPYYPGSSYSKMPASGSPKGSKGNRFIRGQDIAPRLRSGSKISESLAPRLRSGPRGAESGSLAKKTLQNISRCGIVSANGLVVCQHFKKDVLLEQEAGFRLVKQAKYGDTLLSLYEKADQS